MNGTRRGGEGCSARVLATTVGSGSAVAPKAVARPLYRRAARAWFLTIVANQCRSTRRARWWSVVKLPDVQSGQRNLETEKPDLDRALARLPQEDRLALFLHFYLDLPLDEVGTVLGLSAAG